MEKDKKIFEMFVSGFLLLATLYLLYISLTTTNKFVNQGMASMDFPKGIFYIQALFCLIVFVKAFKAYREICKKNGHSPAEGTAKNKPTIDKKVIVSIGLIIIYAACWNILGYLLSTFLFVVAESRVLDSSKALWRSLVFALLTAAFTYIVFGILFQVSLPEPLLELVLG